MRRRLAITLLVTLCAALFALLTGCSVNRVAAPAKHPIDRDWTITATWQFDFTNFVACSATVTKGCVSGFQWGYMQGATPVQLKLSAPSVCTGTTQPESCADTTNATLGIGSVVFYVQSVGVDNSGAAVSAMQATSAPTAVSLLPATNVTVTVK